MREKKYVCNFRKETAEKAERIGYFFIDNDTTIRKACVNFGMSSSNCHVLLSRILPEVNRELSEKVAEKMKLNKKEGVKRGGQTTRMMWRKIREEGVKPKSL